MSKGKKRQKWALAVFPFSRCIPLLKKNPEAVTTETTGGKATETWDSRDALRRLLAAHIVVGNLLETDCCNALRTKLSLQTTFKPISSVAS